MVSEPFAIAGRYFDPGSSRPRPARLLVRDPDKAEQRLRLDGDGEMVRTIAEVSDRIGATERRLTFATGDSFVTPDNDAVDRLAIARGRGWGLRLASLEAFHPRLVLVLLACVGLIFFMVRDGVPLLARGAAAVTPTPIVQALDASGRQTLDGLFFSETAMAPERQDELTARFEALIEVADVDDLRPQLLFRNGGRIGPNALALPGGTVYVTDQLAKILTDDEIEAVLAHEIAHGQNRHSLRQIYRVAGLSAMVAMVLGDPGPVLEEVVGGGTLLLVLQNGRALEREADLEGVRLLHEAGRDPAVLAQALGTLIDAVCGVGACDEAGWLDSHPGGLERRQDILDAAAALEGT